MAIELKQGVTVSADAAPEKRRAVPFRREGISGRDRMFFTERLSLLLETGSALHPSLVSLAGQTDNPLLRALIEDMAEDVMTGKQFSHALARHPEMFSSTYVSLVAASEHGGFLHQVLKELQTMDEKRERLRTSIQSALYYPLFLVFFSFAVVVFVLVVVFPKFGELFGSIREHLPLTTVILMTVSDGLRRYWMIILAVMTGIAVWARHWFLSASGGEQMDRLKLRLPFLREIFAQLYLVQTFRVLSLSLRRGVGVVEALRASRDVVTNRYFHRFMDEVESQVAGGQGMASAFEEADFIPELARQMVRTGEESGNLDVVFERVADFYGRELERRVLSVTKIIEPVLLLVMGLVVGLIVASLILPIFKLTRAVH